jgi:hypothetical protein
MPRWSGAQRPKIGSGHALKCGMSLATEPSSIQSARFSGVVRPTSASVPTLFGRPTRPRATLAGAHRPNRPQSKRRSTRAVVQLPFQIRFSPLPICRLPKQRRPSCKDAWPLLGWENRRKNRRAALPVSKQDRTNTDRAGRFHFLSASSVKRAASGNQELQREINIP